MPVPLATDTARASVVACLEQLVLFDLAAEVTMAPPAPLPSLPPHRPTRTHPHAPPRLATPHHSLVLSAPRRARAACVHACMRACVARSPHSFPGAGRERGGAAAGRAARGASSLSPRRTWSPPRRGRAAQCSSGTQGCSPRRPPASRCRALRSGRCAARACRVGGDRHCGPPRAGTLELPRCFRCARAAASGPARLFAALDDDPVASAFWAAYSPSLTCAPPRPPRPASSASSTSSASSSKAAG